MYASLLIQYILLAWRSNPKLYGENKNTMVNRYILCKESCLLPYMNWHNTHGYTIIWNKEHSRSY